MILNSFFFRFFKLFQFSKFRFENRVVSFAKFQHLGPDLDTLLMNYVYGYVVDDVYTVCLYTCTRVTHRDVEEFIGEGIVVSLAHLICTSQKYTGCRIIFKQRKERKTNLTLLSL